MIRPIILLAALAIAAPAIAQEDSVAVRTINFNKTRDNWIQMEIEVSCLGNPNPEARDDKYLENVGVKAYLAYEVDKSARTFDFYTAEVEIMVMEVGDDYNVYFYLPGLYQERDSLPTTPKYYFVELTVDDQLLPPEKRGTSSNVSNLTILESMKSKADAEAGVNENKLIPIYYVPAQFLGRVDSLPVFVREDPR